MQIKNSATALRFYNLLPHFVSEQTYSYNDNVNSFEAFKTPSRNFQPLNFCTNCFKQLESKGEKAKKKCRQTIRLQTCFEKHMMLVLHILRLFRIHMLSLLIRIISIKKKVSSFNIKFLFGMPSKKIEWKAFTLKNSHTKFSFKLVFISKSDALIKNNTI